METLEFVSLLSLVHTPEIYDGQLVRVIGLCSFAESESGMWLTRRAFSQMTSRDALWLDLEQSADWLNWQGHVMLTEAVFSRDPGPQGNYAGSLINISRLEEYGQTP